MFIFTINNSYYNIFLDIFLIKISKIYEPIKSGKSYIELDKILEN